MLYVCEIKLNKTFSGSTELNYGGKIGVATAYFIVSFCGLIIYIAFLYIVIKHRSTHFKSAFYTLAIGLAAADIPNLLVELTLTVPFLFMAENTALSCILNLIAGLIVNFSYYSLSCQTLLIAVNRLIAVCFHDHYEIIFTSTKVYCQMGFVFFFAAIRSALFYLTGGAVLFSNYSFSYFWAPPTNSFQSIYRILELVLSFVVVGLVATIYFLILAYVKVGKILTKIRG